MAVSMRITNSMMIRRTMYDQNNNLRNVNKYLHDLTSLKKIHKPSDDPIGVSRILKMESEIGDVVSFKESAESAYSFMDKTEGALKEINQVLQRCRELANQGANGVLTTDDKSKIASELGEMKKHLVQVANDTYMGMHIFSGFQSDKPLVDENGNYQNYMKLWNDPTNPNDVPLGEQNIDYKLGISNEITVNLTGEKVFGTQKIEKIGDQLTFPGTYEFNFTLTPKNKDGSTNSTVGTPITINIPNKTYNNINDLVTDLNTEINTFSTANPTHGLSKRVWFSSEKNAIKLEGEVLGVPTFETLEIKETVTAPAGGSLGMNSTISPKDPMPLFKLIDELKDKLSRGDSVGVSSLIKDVDANLSNILELRGKVGAKMKNMETMQDRMDDIKLNVTTLLSSVQDTDVAEANMKLTTYESVYKASLAVSGRLIQPTLIDFLR